MRERGYNGWKNWETWNVALWLENDERLYRVARRCGSYRVELTPQGYALVAVWEAGK